MPERRLSTPPLLRGAALAIALSCGVSVSASAETTDRPGRWIGRADEGSRSLGWPGSGAAFAIEGTRLSVRLENEGENSLVISADGVARRLDLQPGTKTYQLFEGPAGRHDIRLVKRTEGDVGSIRVLSAETDGRFLAPTPPKRRVLVIGDSISAGYGIEGKGPDCSFSPDTENQTLTYAARTAEALNGETTTIAASGRGLVRNYNGARQATMRDLMDRTSQGDARSSEPPLGPFDLVLVHLGTNDFSAGDEPDGFKAAYVELLRTLRQRYPQAPIYALIGPSLFGESFDRAKTAIEAAVAGRRSAGDEAVRFLAFPPPAVSFGCDWHPGSEAHRAMADSLTARVRSDLGW